MGSCLSKSERRKESRGSKSPSEALNAPSLNPSHAISVIIPLQSQSSPSSGTMVNAQSTSPSAPGIRRSPSNTPCISTSVSESVTGSATNRTILPNTTSATIPTSPESPSSSSSRAIVTNTQSTDTSSTHLTVLETMDHPTLGETAKKIAGDVWTGLKSALIVLKETADVFPPLKAAVSGFLACVDIVETAFANHEAYKVLAEHLAQMATTLMKLGRDESDSIARIVKLFKAQADHVKQKLGNSTVKKILLSADDKADILDCYREIEMLFNQLCIDLEVRIHLNVKELLEMVRLQRLPSVDDAKYDSSYADTINRRACTKETRETVLEGLQTWTKDPGSAKIYWLDGMAGTGKTTIAYSFCQWLAIRKQLGASFFCSRTSLECRRLKGIVPTIAYQLALYSSAYGAALYAILTADPNAGTLNIEDQFMKLVVEPLKREEVKAAIPTGVVVVVDALDECESSDGVQRILGLLLKYVTSLPVKFFVTSRPEPIIRRTMESPQATSLRSFLRLHDIEESLVESDIRKYLMDEFGLMMHLPTLADVQIEQLARRARNLFIYAATLIRYIAESPSDSETRLETLLEVTLQSSSGQGIDPMYEDLDILYTTILTAALVPKRAVPHEIQSRRRLLWTVVCAIEPMTLATASLILGLPEKQVSAALEPFHSVLHVSNKVISTLHASFPDFLLNPSRSVNFYCDEKKYSGYLAGRCFDVMKDQLRFNICNLESSSIYDKDVPELEERVKDKIASGLFYACRYWGRHLERARDSQEMHELLYGKLDGFLSERLLFWMEVLNLKKCMGEGPLILSQAQSWLSANKAPADTVRYMSDTYIFVARFTASSCTRSTPHLYLSAFAFCSKSSSVYQHHQHLIQGVRDVKGTVIDQRERAALAVWSLGAWVLSVAFSPEGTRIASGSSDNTVQVWNAFTGEPLGRAFEGHTGSVYSIAFSPDGTRIVSGSGDKTIRVWDALTGDLVHQPLEGHTGEVNSVAFSPDGTRIVSGSDDNTIRLWDASTGKPVGHPFEGHTSRIWSVEFSRDGARIVSGSEDETVRLWNAHTGEPVGQPFEGHTNVVNVVAFSSDGTYIASGADDMTIRLWDASNGKPVGNPFEGHTARVRSVAFSPDGTHIVSGSWDKTIRVWNAATGEPVGHPFEGHTDWVRSVAFSPDGTRIVSGSDDKTIRVWNAHIGDPVDRPFEGHADRVRSVAFSPDGTRIVSGSDDKTVRVWDAVSGVPVGRLLKGHTGTVYSIAFSPDGGRIVSGSRDETVRLWNAHTGEPVGQPFEGHTDKVYVVAFSPDGTRIASGSDDKTIRVWDAFTGELVGYPCEGHIALVRSVAFSPDGTCIVSGSHDHSIRVWHAPTTTFSLDNVANQQSYSNNQWTLESDGWFTTNDNTPLFWTPPDLSGFQPRPSNTVVITPNGTIFVDYSNLVFGDRWAECWVPPS